MTYKLLFHCFFICACLASNVPAWKTMRSATDFKSFVANSGFSTDKTTLHTYETMYWQVLSKLVQEAKTPPRIFEIGLGCFMPHGPGGSANVWRSIFKFGDIHVFEYQRECGRQWEQENPNVAVLHYGDQSNPADLLAAVSNSLPFDLIVDDGSHMSEHQKISLITLWPSVAPGGAYIVEDVHSSCMNWNVPGTKLSTGGGGDCMRDGQNQKTFFAHVVQDWLPVLVRSSQAAPADLPGLESITFYHEAVVFTKKPAL